MIPEQSQSSHQLPKKPLKDEDLFHILVQGVKDYAIFLLDPNGIIISWNEGARRMKGYDENEILGKNFSILYPREDVEKNKPSLALKRAIEKDSYEEEGLRLKKMEHFFTLMYLSLLFIMGMVRTRVLQKLHVI